MATVTLSANGRIALPPDLTQRLGWQGGAEIEMIEEADGLRLLARPPRSAAVDGVACAGLVTAPSKGRPRRLEDFNAAALAAGTR